jgi:hypothetical protein
MAQGDPILSGLTRSFGTARAVDPVGLHATAGRAGLPRLGEDDAELFPWRRDHWATIGHDVWIGHGVPVLPGATIGSTVTGAGAVVSRDVAPYRIVGGLPARLIRRRFTEAQAEASIEIAWWDWSHDAPRAALPDIRALAIDGFIEKYRPAA